MSTDPIPLFRYCLSFLVFILIFIINEMGFAQSSAVRLATVKPHPTNLNFEEDSAGPVPEGWDSPAKNYAVELTDVQPKSGKRAALLRSIPDATGSPFGNLMQAIDATPFRGRRVRLRAAVRTEGDASAPARAQLWLRVDRPAQRMGFFDNMGDRPIFSGEWQYYEIIGDIDDDAATVNIGMILIGKGKAWLDDVSFEDLGKLVERAAPPRPVTDRGLQNLIAFTRLLGYVRHFHPSDQAAATNWDTFAIESIGSVETARNATELAQRLEEVFRPVAPTVRVFPTGKRPRLPDELKPPNDSSLKIVSWRHNGFGQKQGPIYISERERKDVPQGGIPKNALDPFRADLEGGVSVLVPFVLLADAKGTLPHAAAVVGDSKPSLVKYSGNDRDTRLADVALTWNVLQHFYPYFDVVNTDWPRALREALTSAATDADERTFADTLRRMVAELHDGHGNVYRQADGFAFTVPVIWSWIEGRLVITDVAPQGAEGLEPGDVVQKLDDKPSEEVLAAKEALVSGATVQWRRYIALTQLRYGLKDSEMRLSVLTPKGERRSVALRRNIEGQALSEARPPKLHELKPEIFYVNLAEIKDEDFNAALPRLEKAKGIIFDLRGYPSVSPVVISHLIDKPVESARWLVPIVTKPDHAGAPEYDTRGRWNLEPLAPRLRAMVAFLTDGRAISYAESYMGIIEAYKLAEIVGETTAGTNGNVNPFVLPGKYTVVWTGMKVLKHDGSQHHGIGIKPTVPVTRTIRGVTEKRDEQLERAVAIVSQ